MESSIQSTDRLRPLTGLLQAGKFGLVGMSNTVVDAACYFALSSGALALVLPRAAAKAAGYLAGVLNSYYWNRRWTFRSRLPARQTFLPFLLVNLAGMGLNVLLLQFSLQAGLSEPAAVLAATIGAVLWNFLANKLVVFKKPDPAKCIPAESHTTKDGLP